MSIWHQSPDLHPQIWARQLARKDIKIPISFRLMLVKRAMLIQIQQWPTTHGSQNIQRRGTEDDSWGVQVHSAIGFYWIIICCCLWGPDKSLISWWHNGFWLKVRPKKLSSLSEVLISNIVNIAFMYVTYFQVKQNDFVIDEYTVLKYCMLIHHYLTFKHFFFGINRYDTSIQ